MSEKLVAEQLNQSVAVSSTHSSPLPVQSNPAVKDSVMTSKGNAGSSSVHAIKQAVTVAPPGGSSATAGARKNSKTYSSGSGITVSGSKQSTHLVDGTNGKSAGNSGSSTTSSSGCSSGSSSGSSCGGVRYTLRSVVLHHGPRPSEGHYSSMCRDDHGVVSIGHEKIRVNIAQTIASNTSVFLLLSP